MPPFGHVRFPSSARFAVALLSACLSGLAAGGYDPPRFDQPLFDADALSLGPQETGEIVTALTALVSNFPDEAQVDGDVREKAMTVALGLRPLDEGARSAHRSLTAGSPPKPVELFSSVSAISSALWRYGERLAQRSAEPEDRKLAPLLMELSFLARQGRPEPERLRAFQRAAETAPLNWSRAVELQRDENASNQRATAFFRPVPEPETPTTLGATDPPSARMEPSSPDSGGTMATPLSDDRPVSEIKRRDGKVNYLGRDENSGTVMAGVASLAVREPTVDETSLFGLFTDQETRRTFEMRLTYDREGATVSGIDLVEPFIRRQYPRWPLQLLAEFGFHPSGEGGETRQVNLALPALILLATAFSGDEIADSFAPGGEYALAGLLSAEGVPRLPGSAAVAEHAQAAGKSATPPKVLFLPAKGDDAGAATSLLEAAVDGEPMVLIRPQVIGFASFDELRPLLLGQTPEALLAAIGDFAAIQALTEKMEIGAIARNEVVRGRLGKVLESWPGHVSARALLDFGARPVDAGMTLGRSIKSIESALEPVFEQYRSREAGEGFVASTTAERIDAARVALAELRRKIDPQAKPFLTGAEDALDAAKVYLSLTNLGTSIAQQRHRELQERVAEWHAERAKLSVEAPAQ